MRRRLFFRKKLLVGAAGALGRLHLAVAACSAQEAVPTAVAPGGQAGIEHVSAAVDRLASQAGTQAGTVGFSLRFLEAPGAEGAETLPAGIPDAALATNGDKSLLPASTLKTVTTGCALEILGADYQFPTVLQHDGEIDAVTGALRGNVFVRGSGDPTLAEIGWSGLFAEWLAALQEAGIKSIDGSVVGDGSVFGSRAVSGAWAWDDIGNYYAPPVTGLNFHRNTFYISFAPGAVGAIASLTATSPAIPGLNFVNEMRTGAADSGDQGYVYGAPYAETYVLRGTIPEQPGAFSIKGAIPDPAFFCAHRLNVFLKAKGLSIVGDPTTARRGKFETHGPRIDLRAHLSAPLGQLIRRVNHESLNLDAEALLKAIGREASGTGSTEAGANAVNAFLTSNGVDTTGFDMADACGLSRANAITPNQLTAILALFQNLAAAEPFRASLPVAGRTGTLKSIGGGTPAEGRIHAKSGTVHRVKCYAGYIDCQSGATAAFAIMVHQYTGEYPPIKAGITSIMARLAEM